MRDRVGADPDVLSAAVFRSPWTWATPLLGAAAVFVFVLVTTPPGFSSVPDVLFGSPRGVNADAAAYALGAAASLALGALLGLAVVMAAIETILRRRG
jgi:hypothetical protein